MTKSDTSNSDNSTKTRARRKAQRLGHRGETLAVWALRLKGYRIAERRYRTKLGEIDIIARKKDLVAIIEVKARNTVEDAVNAVGIQSQKRITNAAIIWLARQADYANLSLRFDIIAIVPGRWPHHIENAW